MKLGIIALNSEGLDLRFEGGSQSVLFPVLLLGVCLISALLLLIEVLIKSKNEVALENSGLSVPAQLRLQLVLCEHFFLYIIYIIIKLINCDNTFNFIIYINLKVKLIEAIASTREKWDLS